MPDKYHISKGVIKVHDGKPIKSGESVISERLFSQITASETDANIEKEKNAAKKIKLQEAKFLTKMKVRKDDQSTKKVVVK